MGKIFDSTKIVDPYYLLTQTPKNYSKDNYYLKNLQDKINYDWDYRPNRVDIEEEIVRGTNEYSPIETVIQTVKDDKGKEISDDWRRLVFKDMSTKQIIGKKFRFSYDFNIQEKEENKSVWLASNMNSVQPTNSAVIVRCNGTLGSAYLDNNGITQYYYEPAIQTNFLKTVNLFYNQVAVVPQSELAVIVQHNDFTKNYYINQRFVVGYDRVYKIKALNKFNALYTYQPKNVSTILLYLEITEISEKDNFENQIAYNNQEEIKVEEVSTNNYKLIIVQPEKVPLNLLSESVNFEIKLFLNEQEVSSLIEADCTLQGTDTPEKYFNFTRINNNSFTLKRLRFYAGAPLIIKCYSSESEETSLEFSLSLKGIE